MTRLATPFLRLFAAALTLAAFVAAPPAGAAPADEAPPELWSVAAPAPAPWRVHPLVSAVLLEDASGGITALDPSSGVPRWRVDMGGPLDVAPREHAGVTVLGAGRRCVAVDVATGGILDQRTLPSPLAAPAVVHQGLLHTLTLEGALHVSSLGGDRLWSYRGRETLGDQLRLVPTRERALLVVAEGSRELVALPSQASLPSDVTWRATVNAAPRGPLQLVGDTLLATLDDGELLALAAESGRVRWRNSLPGLPGAPLLTAGDVLLTGGAWGLQARAVDDGRVLWSRPDAALPRAANSSSALIQVGDRSATWLRARDGRPLTLPKTTPSQLGAELLLAWDGPRLRAFSARHALLARDGGKGGALN